jgi:hypothetical protein
VVLKGRIKWAKRLCKWEYEVNRENVNYSRLARLISANEDGMKGQWKNGIEGPRKQWINKR